MLLGVAAAAVTLAGKNNVSPAWSPDSSRIAFVSDGPRTASNSHNIWVMRRDGSGKLDVTPDRNRDVDPAWSPDGRTLAFTSASLSSPPTVEVVGADGIGRRTIANGSQPAWSPDGTELAYAAPHQLRAVDADGTNDRLLVAGDALSPAWSPDGKRIAYVEGGDIWVVGADGSNPQIVRNGDTGSSWSPTWSQSGALACIFHSAFGGYDTVYGGGALGLDLTAIDSISWSGDRLVITGANDPNSDFDVYVGRTDVTHDRTWDEHGVLSPDGRVLAYGVRFGHGSEESDIWTLDLRTRIRRNLTGVDTGVTVAARAVKRPVIRSVQPLLAGDILLVTVHMQDGARDDVQGDRVRITYGKTSYVVASDTHGEAIVSFPMTSLKKGQRVTLLIRVGRKTRRVTARL